MTDEDPEITVYMTPRSINCHREAVERIYIAGPMRGYPAFNFPAFFEAEERLLREGYEVFNPARRDNQRHGRDISVGNESGCLEQAAAEHGFNLATALSEDLSWICETATAIYMLPGWESSKGATAELAAATAIGLEVIYELPELEDEPIDVSIYCTRCSSYGHRSAGCDSPTVPPFRRECDRDMDALVRGEFAPEIVGVSFVLSEIDWRDADWKPEPEEPTE